MNLSLFYWNEISQWYKTKLSQIWKDTMLVNIKTTKMLKVFDIDKTICILKI